MSQSKATLTIPTLILFFFSGRVQPLPRISARVHLYNTNHSQIWASMWLSCLALAPAATSSRGRRICCWSGSLELVWDGW
jgi:hypothetical protein